MQNNFTTFRPEIKDVKIKKVELICDTYHVYGIRADIRHNCCDRKMNIHDYRTVAIRRKLSEMKVIHSDRKGRKYEYINCHEDIS